MSPHGQMLGGGEEGYHVGRMLEGLLMARTLRITGEMGAELRASG